VRLNSKAQVTIPAPPREKHGLRDGDEVDVAQDGHGSRIAPVRPSQTRGTAAGGPHARTCPPAFLGTGQLLGLLRDE